MNVAWEGLDERVTITLDTNECDSLFEWLNTARTHYIDAEVWYENEGDHYQAGVMQVQSQGIDAFLKQVLGLDRLARGDMT